MSDFLSYQQVLYPDGKVSRLSNISAIECLGARTESPQRAASVAPPDPEPAPTAKDAKDSSMYNL